MEEVTDEDEIAFAKLGMFQRHPITASWPPGHGFRFYKLAIQNILVLDYYGGPHKHSDPDLGTGFLSPDMSTKSGCPLNRGQIRLISYIGGKKSCP
eukprot:sb/3479129/